MVQSTRQSPRTRYGPYQRFQRSIDSAHSTHSGSRARASSLQHVGRHRVYELHRRRPIERDPMFSERPADVGTVAVVVPDELLRSVVEEEQLRPRGVRANEELPVDVRPFEVLRPMPGQREEAAVKLVECRAVAIGERILGHDEKVHVAPLVRAADGERAVQVRADQIRPENCPHARDKLGQNAVEFGELRPHSP